MSCVTETQNWYVWKGPLEFRSPTPHHKKSDLELVAKDHVQRDLEYFQGWRLLNLSGHPVQCSLTLTMKKGSLVFRQSLLCFTLCPMSLVLSQGTMQKSLASSHHPSQYLYTVMRGPRRLLFSVLNSTRSLSWGLHMTHAPSSSSWKWPPSPLWL